MANEGSENTWDNFREFIYLLEPKTKTLVSKLVFTKCVFIILSNMLIYIYIYIYILSN